MLQLKKDKLRRAQWSSEARRKAIEDEDEAKVDDEL
jgi:hypothetical protein